MRLLSLVLALYLGSVPYISAHEHSDVTAKSSEQKVVRTKGTIKSIGQDHKSLRIFHDPIPELNWPAMNMPFEVVDGEMTSSLSVGDRIYFEFIQKEGKDTIIKIEK